MILFEEQMATIHQLQLKESQDKDELVEAEDALFQAKRDLRREEADPDHSSYIILYKNYALMKIKGRASNT